MSLSKSNTPIPKYQPTRPSDSFKVTREVVIGEVGYDPDAEHGPYSTAFLLIGETGEEGTYRFPGADEGEVVIVTVEHQKQS